MGRTRQRQGSDDEERPRKKQKMSKVFEGQEFLLNEADPALADVLEQNGAQVFLFSFSGGGFDRPIYVQVTPDLTWEQICYTEATGTCWVKKEFVSECLKHEKMLDEKDFISFQPGRCTDRIPWYVELSNKEDQECTENFIKSNGGALVKLPFFGQLRIISDEETSKTSPAIYNHMRREQTEGVVDDRKFSSIHTRALVEQIANKELSVYECETSEDTLINYDKETVQLALEQFTRYPFRMQRYDIKAGDFSTSTMHTPSNLAPENWRQILLYLPLKATLEFATLSKTCHNIVHGDDHYWFQQSQAAKDTWYWAENIQLEQIKPKKMTWFEFFKTRVHPLILDELWFNKVSRNPESPEDIEEAQTSFKINVQMDFKRIDDTTAQLGQSQLGGRPHLPASMTWPEGQQFVLQINLEELVASVSFALHNFPLPKKGIVYYFESCLEDRTKILYYDGPVDQLALRDVPEGTDSMPAHAVKFFETLSPNMFKLDSNISTDLFVRRAIQGDRSVLGWDYPLRAEECVVTNMEENEDDHEGGGDEENDAEDETGGEDEQNSEDEDEDEEGEEKHNQLLLCLHSFGEVKFGDEGALVIWLPHDRVPKDPEHCNPSKFKYKWHLDPL